VRALLLGPVLHLLGDVIPHRDIGSMWFEGIVGVSELAVLAAVRGPLDPATLGAAAASAPDLEHVLPLPKPRGADLFPSHRFASLHREGGLSAELQMLVAGALLGGLLVASAARFTER
jgi:hypothetical protein